MGNEREKLKEVIDFLTDLYEDENHEITFVNHSLHSSKCSQCKTYGDSLFENIAIVSERSK